MSFELQDLDPLTRRQMLVEFARDRHEGRLPVCRRVMAHRRADLYGLLQASLADGTPERLEATLMAGGMLLTHELRERSGMAKMVRVPCNAARLIAGGTFNHYYVRAVCQRALAYGVEWVQVYRARPSARPRAKSQALVGAWVGAQAVYEDLLRPAPILGVPGGPSSGISVRLPRQEHPMAGQSVLQTQEIAVAA